MNYSEIFLKNKLIYFLIYFFGPTLILKIITFNYNSRLLHRLRNISTLKKIFKFNIEILNHSYFKKEVTQYYDHFIVKKKVSRISLIRFFIYFIFRIFNIHFLWNISEGVGHYTQELDFFLRCQKLGNFKKKKIIFIKRKSQYHDFTIKYLRNKFFFVSDNGILYDFLSPIVSRYESLIIDAGFSRAKYHFNKKKKIDLDNEYFFRLSTQENNMQNAKWYEVKCKTENYKPLGIELRNIDKSFLLYINYYNKKKIALIHIKDRVINACGKKIDPLSMKSSIEKLQKTHTVIFIGREKMPEVFKKLNILNYSESVYASYENDVLLFQIADLAIINASGLAHLAEAFALNFLYINSWHIHLPLQSSNCLYFPSVVLDKKKNALLNFNSQVNLYLNHTTPTEIFDEDEYECLNISDDQLIALLDEFTSVDNKEREKYYKLIDLFNKNINKDAKLFSKSKISISFLKKYKKLL